jgi:hypothetical protein
MPLDPDSATPAINAPSGRRPLRAWRHTRRCAIAVAGCMTVATSMLIGIPGTAMASAGQYCGTYGSGLTNDTVWYKKPPGCHDLNVTYTAADDSSSDYYAGFYWTGSKWQEGSKGYQLLYNGNHNPNTDSHAVLLTNVATGTEMYIGAYVFGANGHDIVHINY